MGFGLPGRKVGGKRGDGNSGRLAVDIKIEIRDGAQVPMLAGTGCSVADAVRTLHEVHIDAGLAQLGIDGLTRETIEPVLTYCAERRCVAAAASCAGCRRRSELQGTTTLDQFVAAQGEIIVGDGRVLLRGQGQGVMAVESLDRLAASW